MTEAAKPSAMDGYIDTEFYLTARRDGGEGRRIPVVVLSCRFQDCGWGETVGEMELWEFVADARAHWEDKHAKLPDARKAVGDRDYRLQ